jgi:hypothetical protein
MFKPFKSFGRPDSFKVQGFKSSRFFGSESAMKAYAKVVAWSLVVVALHSTVAAETLEQLIAGAKKEPELTFIAGAQTFGGQKTLNLLEGAFNKRFGLNMKIRFAAGPEMNSMAARVITELKNGSKASSDIYHGSQSHVSLLHKE